MNQTRNLLIWSQMCYHCATNPLPICHSSFNATRPVNYTQAQYTMAKVKFGIFIIIKGCHARKRVRKKKLEPNMQSFNRESDALPLGHGSLIDMPLLIPRVKEEPEPTWIEHATVKTSERRTWTQRESNTQPNLESNSLSLHHVSLIGMSLHHVSLIVMSL